MRQNVSTLTGQLILRLKRFPPAVHYYLRLLQFLCNPLWSAHEKRRNHWSSRTLRRFGGGRNFSATWIKVSRARLRSQRPSQAIKALGNKKCSLQSGLRKLEIATGRFP